MPRLVRKFGLFQCKCNRSAKWASAHVYCHRGTRKVAFKQKCKQCETPRFPYWVRHLRCPFCQLPVFECICEFDEEEDEEEEWEEEEEVEGRRDPHRSDLCLKCEAGLPCIRRRNYNQRRY